MFSQVTECRGFNQLVTIQTTHDQNNDVHWLLCASVVTVNQLTLLVDFESHIQQHNKMKKTNIVNMHVVQNNLRTTWHAVHSRQKKQETISPLTKIIK